MRALRRATGLALLLTYAVIVLGAWVRASGSGLSCPDWPTCYGHWVPLPGEIPPDAGYAYYQVMLEWVHRLLAGVILGPLVLLIGWLAWRRRQDHPRMPAYAAALIGLLLVQAGLGGVTVLDQNSPWSVALHLSTALLLLSALCLILARSRPALARPAGAAGPLSMAVWLLALSAMASAAMTTKSGAALACSTWPLCDGALIPDLSDPAIRLNFSHRVLALGVGLGALALYATCRGRSDLGPLSSLVLLLTLAEIALGALVVLWLVPLATAILHQALGVLIFGAIALLMVRANAPVAAPQGVHVRSLSRA
ncbi:MAG TPA: COX15/CtaA family protein [Geminicoccaceae bacterium]